ncbi:nuclear pore complex assembly-domain-containing protein [Amylostereum chailletii]|nr:nuclear pore complex assembly-domain-containing protein [Amylostereum chailletii]
MDTYENEPTSLMDLFDTSLDRFPWRGSRPQEIEDRRGKMSDLLIFDILLSSGGLRQPDALWPPTDVVSLQRLLDAIQDSSYDALKKDCLIYFLLKWHQDGREEYFKEQKCIPPQFVALSDAYWHLDSGINIDKAVSLLSDVRLNRDYSSKILQALSLADNSTSLILQYVRTAKPQLNEPKDIDLYILALAESSLMEAWQFQRTFPDDSDTRSRLLRTILEWCLSPKPRSKHLAELIAFPFSSYEQAFVHSFALDPPSTLAPASIPIVQDLVCVRLIQAGQFAKAIKMDRQFASTLTAGRAQHVSDTRRQMIEEVLAALPTFERLELEDELSSIGRDRQQLNGYTTIAKDGASTTDLSMSWETVEPVSHPPQPAPVASGSNSAAPSEEASQSRKTAPRLSYTNSPMHQPVNVVGRKSFPFGPSTSAFQSSPQLTSSQHQPPPIAALSTANGRSAGANAPVTNGFTYSNGAPSLPATTAMFQATTSASQKPNAFYTPPAPKANRPPSTSPKRMSSPKQGPARPTVEDDFEMHPESAGGVEDFLQSDAEATDHANTDEPPSPVVAPTFNQSLFSASASRVVRPEHSIERLPPGAFQLDENDNEPEPVPEPAPEPESEPLSTRTRNRAREPPSPSTSPPPAKSRQTTSSRQKRAAPSLNRSIPGGFVDEDHQSDDEDEVPPLPDVSPVKRTTRKGRSSRAYVEEDAASVKPRRSSRLSVASSSPEPPSPQKISAGRTRKPRVSTTSGASTSTRPTRRKR